MNKLILIASVFIGVWFNQICAMKRKSEEQKIAANKKFCCDDLSIDINELNAIYSMNYEPTSPNYANNMLLQGIKILLRLNNPVDFSKATVDELFDMWWTSLVSMLVSKSRPMELKNVDVMGAMEQIFSPMDDDLWDSPEENQNLYRTAIAKALESTQVSMTMGYLTQYFKLFIYNLHRGTNAQKLFSVFAHMPDKAHQLEQMLFASSSTLALKRRVILQNLKNNNFEVIKEIPEIIRFHPTMITNAGQSILAYLIQNYDQLDIDLAKLFIGQVAWDKKAIHQAAQTKQRLDIIDELNRFQNNCNDMMIH